MLYTPLLSKKKSNQEKLIKRKENQNKILESKHTMT